VKWAFFLGLLIIIPFLLFLFVVGMLLSVFGGG
jgi:hypothetical protein